MTLICLNYSVRCDWEKMCDFVKCALAVGAVRVAGERDAFLRMVDAGVADKLSGPCPAKADGDRDG